MALFGLGRDVARGDVDDDVAGEGVATNVADESDMRVAVRGGMGKRSGGGEMELKVVPENGAVNTTALVAGAVSAYEDDWSVHGPGCELGGCFGGFGRR